MKILALDFSSLFTRNWMASQGKEFSEAYNRTIQAVQRFRDGFDRVAVCCDSGPSFRRALWPASPDATPEVALSLGYKGNRTDRGEPFREQSRRTVQQLALDGCTIFKAPAVSHPCMEDGTALYAEADDVIGALCAWAAGAGFEVAILTGDKDLFQCLTDSVSAISLTDGKVYGPARVVEKYGIPPAQIPLMLALAGDASDNYKPFAGIGDTVATALLKRFGSLGDIFDPANAEAVRALINNTARSNVLLAPGAFDVAQRALSVAKLRTNLELDFTPLLAEPEYKRPETRKDAPMDDSRDEMTEREPAQPVTAMATRPKQETKPAVQRARSATLAPAPANDIAQLPYWAQPGYLASLSEVAVAFTAAQCFPNVARMEQVMVVAMMAAERGIGLATAMQHAYFVKGKLSWSGAYLSMLVRSSGFCDDLRVVKHDENICTIRAQRTGQPAREISFSFQDAENSGISKQNSSVWTPYRKQMLYWSALRTAIRQEWPDVVAGYYMPDERDNAPEQIIIDSLREAA
jgi:5'-3' exonuclease